MPDNALCLLNEEVLGAHTLLMSSAQSPLSLGGVNPVSSFSPTGAVICPYWKIIICGVRLVYANTVTNLVTGFLNFSSHMQAKIAKLCRSVSLPSSQRIENGLLHSVVTASEK